MDGSIFVISSASGVGKTTLCKMMLERYPDLSTSISVTTRTPRRGEIDSKDYFFVINDKFDNMVSTNRFVEHANVYGMRYGTLMSEVERIFSEGKTALFEMDWQGVRQVREVFEDRDVVLTTVYVLPPSVKTVYNRLVDRDTDSRDSIDKRMSLFLKDIGHACEYDYNIINDDLETAFNELCAIYEMSRMRVKTKRDMVSFVKDLQEEDYK